MSRPSFICGPGDICRVKEWKEFGHFWMGDRISNLGCILTCTYSCALGISSHKMLVNHALLGWSLTPTLWSGGLLLCLSSVPVTVSLTSQCQCSSALCIKPGCITNLAPQCDVIGRDTGANKTSLPCFATSGFQAHTELWTFSWNPLEKLEFLYP